MSEQVPGWGVKLQTEVSALQEDVAGLERSKSEQHKEMWTAIDALKETMNMRLPLWTTALISILSSTTVGLIVYVVTH